MGLTRADMITIAARTGLPVVAAWVAGNGVMGPVEGTVLHHTATSAAAPGDYPSLNIVRYGRPGLVGTLCNFGLGRSGTIYLVTEGIAWHAGVAAWNGTTDVNGHYFGIEAENPGLGTAWPAVQLDAYERLVASILYFLGKDTKWDARHASVALPSGRKTDTAGFDMAAFDAKVVTMLANPASINRNTSSSGDISMADAASLQAQVERLYEIIVWNREPGAAPGSHGPSWPSLWGLRDQTQTLAGQVTAQNTEIAALKTQVASQNTQITNLTTQVTALAPPKA